MKRVRSLAAALTVAATGLTVGAVAASSAGASPSSARLSGGATSVVIAPGTAGALLDAHILPLPVNPGSETPATQGSPTVQVTFPVTGGSVNLSQLTGDIRHSGGLDFYDVATGTSLVIQDFDITLGANPQLTAEVPALKARVPIFDLSLSSAHVATPNRHTVDVTGIAVTLDPTAASALDSTFSTTLFTGGLPIGTASTQLQLGRW